MGRAFTPHIVTEDSASGAQVIDGSLRFDKSLNQHLTRTPSTNGNKRTWTLSLWAKRTIIDNQFHTFMSVHNVDNDEDLICIDANQLRYRYANGNDFETEARFRDAGWYHIVVTVDSTLSTSSDRIIYYVNGTRQDVSSTGSEAQEPSLNYEFRINNTQQHAIGKFLRYAAGDYDGYMTQYYLIDGQALGPENFGFTDPLTNTWRPKKFSGTFGTNGFYLPMDGNSPIGEDKSGNGNNWTPINFGGSNSIEKATGALPILNTVSGGNYATVGVRTDANADNLAFALPLAGDIVEATHKINNTRTPLTFTDSGSNSNSNSHFYGSSRNFDGSNDFLKASIPNGDALHLQASSWTIECWFNADVLPGGNDVYLGGVRIGSVAFNSDVCWNLRIYNDVIEAMIVTGNTQHKTVSPYSITATKWTHVAYVRDGNEQRLYVDGVLVATTSHTTTPNLNNSSFLEIGGRTGSGYFNGKIQDFRIYTNLAKYTSNFIPAATSPDILPDTPSGVSGGSKLAKVTDGAVYFDGSGDYLEIPNSTDFQFGTDDWTIEFFWNGKPTGSYTSVITTLISSEEAGTWRIGTRFNSTNKLYFARGTGGGFTDRLIDVNVNDGIWYHIAFVRSSGVIIPFVDGVDRTSDLANGNLNDSNSMTTSNPVKIGYNQRDSAYINGFLSNLRIIKGTALYTTDFTPPTAPLTDVTNTKLLCCQSNTSATAAAVTPGTITANGDAAATTFNPFNTDINTVRGQETGYATLNPLDNNGGVLSNGNLTYGDAGSDGWNNSRATIGASSGKWYWEMRVDAINQVICASVAGPAGNDSTNGARLGYLPGQNDDAGVTYYDDGRLYHADSQSSGQAGWGAAYGATDVIGIALDMDDSGGKVWFSKNGSWQASGNPSTGANAARSDLKTYADTYFPTSGTYFANTTQTFNFGQKPFKFPPPTGFQPLNGANVRPETVIADPGKHFKTVLYTGSGSSKAITGVGFQPDFVWVKSRTNPATGIYHTLVDSVRGAPLALFSNSTDAEDSPGGVSSPASVHGGISSFDNNGFSIMSGSIDTFLNNNGTPYVAWCWKAGGAAVSNSDGSITSQVSVNQTAGFSIVSYTGTGSATTVGHGLSQAPEMVITKNRSATQYWIVQHTGLSGATYNMYLQRTDFEQNDSQYTAIGNSTLTVNGQSVNTSSNNYISYCWHSVEGFSKFGSYVGNASTDGPFVYCGFKPAFVLCKITTTSGNWVLKSNHISTNPNDYTILPDTADIEFGPANTQFDFLSNGFKIRTTSALVNTSGATIAFAAFAESPAFNLYGAQSNAR